MWSILLFVRNAAIGTVSVGLVMGACLLAHFLFRLSRLPKACREYRERSYHLESETLLRYVITILCLITLNILFYTFFELGKTCTHIGIVSWTVYLAGGWAKSKLKQVSKWGDIYILICIGICRQKNCWSISHILLYSLIYDIKHGEVIILFKWLRRWQIRTHALGILDRVGEIAGHLSGL